MSELTTQGKIRRALADLGELTDLHPLSIDAIREAIENLEGQLEYKPKLVRCYECGGTGYLEVAKPPRTTAMPQECHKQAGEEE